MQCPFCKYPFYTLRNAVREDTGNNTTGKVDPGRIARKLWLNCPRCERDFPAWVHFAYTPEDSLAYFPSDPKADDPPVLD